MAIEIIPYSTVGPLRLGITTKHECELLLGVPLKSRTNRNGIEELQYKQLIVRFAPKTLTLRECTLLPFADASVNGIRITWDKDFLRRACEQDPDPRDVYGFIVLASLGIAVTGVHDNDESQLAVTAFSIGDFDDLLPAAAPYKM